MEVIFILFPLPGDCDNRIVGVRVVGKERAIRRSRKGSTQHFV